MFVTVTAEPLQDLPFSTLLKAGLCSYLWIPLDTPRILRINVSFGSVVDDGLFVHAFV